MKRKSTINLVCYIFHKKIHPATMKSTHELIAMQFQTREVINPSYIPCGYYYFVTLLRLHST